jgi:hypothetical protein
MNFKTLEPILCKLHSWIGSGLAPLFLLIAPSGAMLTFKSIVQQLTTFSTNAVSVSPAQQPDGHAQSKY